MPGASRGGHARHRQERALTFARSLRPASLLPSTQVDRVVRKPARAGTRFAGLPPRQRGVGQRNWHRLVPASSGVKAPLACEGRRLEGCARVSNRLQKSANDAIGSEKLPPPANGGSGREPGIVRAPQGAPDAFERRRRPAPRGPSRGAGRIPSRAFERTSRGRGFRSMEGTPDRFHGRLVHASRSRAISAAPVTILERASDSGVEGRGDRGVRGPDAHAAVGRERPPRRRPTAKTEARATHRSQWR